MSNKKSDFDEDKTFDFDICKACSSMDCTGLIPAAPASEAEYESYEALYHFLPPEAYVSESADALSGTAEREAQEKSKYSEKARAKAAEDTLRGRMKEDS